LLYSESKEFNVQLSRIATGLLLLGACVVGEAYEDGQAGEDLGEENHGSDPLAARVCADGATVFGIDVSHHQGTVDWARAAAGGVKYAFIRVSDGANTKDREFARNWSASKAAGVVRGAYQFFRPAQSVTAQADLFIAAVGKKLPGDLPPVIDVEVDSGVAPATIAARVRQWVDRVKAGTGATPIVYTGKYFWRDKVGAPSGFTQNPLWIANYTTKCPDIPTGWADWTFWQTSATGVVPGIAGNVDMNKFNGTLTQLQVLTK
jgi:lysozyme